MTTPMQKRWRITLIIAAVVLAFIISTGASRESTDTGEIVQAAPHTSRQATPAPANGASEPVQLRKIERTEPVKANTDVFQPKTWYVPPPPPPPAPPPAPTAPPLPFQLLGKVMNPDGTFTIFLSNQNRVILIKGGETIDGMYHVDSITDRQLVLTYLPLKMQQFLNLGDTP